MSLPISVEGYFTKISGSELSAYLTSCYINSIHLYKLETVHVIGHVSFFCLTEDNI